MCEGARLLSQLWHDRRATSRHVIFLNLLLKFFLKLFLNICVQDKDHEIFDSGSRSDGPSLPRNWYSRERYVLGIVQGQDHDSLGVVIGQIKTNSTPCSPSFVDPTLSLIISSFHFWYHNYYFRPLLELAILVASTQHALRTLRASLRSTKQPRTQFANSPKYKYKVPWVQVSETQVFYGQVRTRMFSSVGSATALLQGKQGY